MLIPNKTILDYALEYLEQGFSVIPIHTKTRVPEVPWKIYQKQFPTKKKLHEWFENKTDVSISIVTGKISGVVVLDGDTQEGCAWIEKNYPHANVVNITTRGKHFYYKYPPGGPFPALKSVTGFYKDVDLKGDGGLAVAPPSLHYISKKPYRWEFFPDGWDGLSEFPIVTHTGSSVKEGGRDLSLIKPVVNSAFGVCKGNRNSALASICGGYLSKNLSLDDTIELCKIWNQRCLPPLGSKEFITTILSIYKINIISSSSEEPIPLLRKANEPRPYPFYALGDVLGAAGCKMFENINAPDAICAHSLLGFAAHSVQGIADIVTLDGRRIPLNEFFLSIGSKSSRKTECDARASAMTQNFQEKLLIKYRSDNIEYKTKVDFYEAKKKAALKGLKTTGGQDLNKIIRDLSDVPQKPYNPILVFSDPTIQGIFKLFESGTPSKYLCADEGGQVTGGHSMKEEEKVYTATQYSKWWDGTSIDRIRGDDAVVLTGKRLSIHLMMQDDIAMKFLNDAVMRNQGLISRFLCAYPKSLLGERKYVSKDITKSKEFEKYHDTLEQSLSVKLNIVNNSIVPREVTISDTAHDRWEIFYNDVESRLSKGGEYESIQGFAGKAPNHVIRLAGILTLFEDPEAEEIKVLAMDQAATLVDYYLSERLRMTLLDAEDQGINNADKLLMFIKRRGLKRISLPDIYNFGPSCYRTKKSAVEGVDLLESHGWLKPADSGGTDLCKTNRLQVWEFIDIQKGEN